MVAYGDGLNLKEHRKEHRVFEVALYVEDGLGNEPAAIKTPPKELLKRPFKVLLN